jgi:hypothetical protein
MPEVGNTADSYLEVRGGKATLVAWSGETGRSGREVRTLWGDYHKEDGVWVLVDPQSGYKAQLRATIFSLTMTESDGSKQTWRRLWR